jgi:hypothetical protein
MRVFVFISTVDQDVLGFTSEKSGSNLPPSYAPWTSATPAGAMMMSGDPDAELVMQAIQKDGFCLAVGGYEDEPEKSVTIH